jgi:hypothetical protein
LSSTVAVLNKANIEDAHIRSQMNHGTADKLFIDPLVLSAYNKIMWNKRAYRARWLGSGCHWPGPSRQFTSGGAS